MSCASFEAERPQPSPCAKIRSMSFVVIDPKQIVASLKLATIAVNEQMFIQGVKLSLI